MLYYCCSVSLAGGKLMIEALRGILCGGMRGFQCSLATIGEAKGWVLLENEYGLCSVRQTQKVKTVT